MDGDGADRTRLRMETEAEDRYGFASSPVVVNVTLVPDLAQRLLRHQIRFAF